jgi:hypothetical protein
MKLPFLTYLGGRRPSSLADQGQYAEQVSRPKAEPIKHKNPKGIDGTSMGTPGRKGRAR